MNTLKSLEALDFNLPMAGNEGLDANYVSRIRIQYLLMQHQSIITQMQFADAKAAALITLVGIVALRSPIFENINNIGQLGIFIYLIIASLSLSMFFTLLSVFPRYPPKKQRAEMWQSDRWSWPALASHDFSPDEYADFVRTAEVSQLIQSVALSNTHISTVLLKKYRVLRLGFIFGTISFVLGIAILTSVV